MKTVTLPGGEKVAALGQGTWMMGERHDRRGDEIAALRTGVEFGMTLIDTAEMYGDGAAESLIGEALGHVRDRLFLVSKAYPQNASRKGLVGACEASLKRLGTDRLDLYLLHWRGVGATRRDRRGDGGPEIRGQDPVTGASATSTPTIWKSLSRRAEAPASPTRSSTISRGGAPNTTCCPGLRSMASRPWRTARSNRDGSLPIAPSPRSQPTIGATPAQVALAWAMRHDGVIAIPKAGSVDHVRENRAAADLVLSDANLASPRCGLPAPTHSSPP